MEAANLGAQVQALTREQAHSILRRAVRRYRLTPDEIEAKLRIYNNWPELNLEERLTHGD